MSAPARTLVVDADVHCAPRSLEDLLAHMDPYWRTYVVEAGIGLSPTQGGAYPARIRPGGEPAHAVDELPVDAAVAVLTCTSTFQSNRNPYYEAALCRAVNDWLLEQWHTRDDRLRVAMVVPTLHTEAAVEEIARIGGHPAVVAVLLPVRNDTRWGTVGNRAVLRAAAEHGLVVTLHAWGRAGNAPNSSGMTHSYLEDYLANSQLVAQGQLTSLVVEGVFAQLPDLRVTVAECGSTWLPTMLWRFDKDWKGTWREVPWLDRPPSEIVREHVRFTTAPIHLPPDPGAARETLDLLDPALLMHASDHPHDHGDGADRLAAVLTDDEKAAVMGGTAAEWYRLGL
ncbi:MAG: amidohydrolase [Pseudonocardia sp.]|uniref:amidohydrolase family protein n=1 Tax=unclassified Pseudonocardia TaxID=2619320 RepID=UPI00086BB0B5|nr:MULTISPECIES: amidohydrolase family protein [unclassified Pseudonocardia]MBN9107464.1 amidohydrolase [Pseudonocardia sp.]ODU12881.1 MAG: hydrolase [Pseudonocardia sp. SCN 72-51]ODV08329.1 MAG: hydrolase [Pseudonocardia sp. SCN 73-27]